MTEVQVIPYHIYERLPKAFQDVALSLEKTGEVVVEKPAKTRKGWDTFITKAVYNTKLVLVAIVMRKKPVIVTSEGEVIW